MSCIAVSGQNPLYHDNPVKLPESMGSVPFRATAASPSSSGVPPPSAPQHFRSASSTPPTHGPLYPLHIPQALMPPSAPVRIHVSAMLTG